MKTTPENGKIWIARINIIKMAILPKAVYRSNAISIKIPSQFFTDLERTQLHMEKQKPRVAKPSCTVKRPPQVSPPLISSYTVALVFFL